MSGENLQILKSSRNADMLYLDGYLFYRNQKKKDKHYWECQNRNHTTKEMRSCTARATTELVDGKHILLSKMPTHDHESVPRSADALKLRENIKRRACSDSGPPAKLLRAEAVGFSSAVQQKLTVNAQVKILKRARPAAAATEPTSLDTFVIPDEYKKTLSGSLFYQGQVEEEKGNGKALVFVSDQDIRRLAQGQYWVADATFDTVPGIFQQLFTVHGSIGPEHNNSVPMAYALMTSKSEELYEKVLDQLSLVASRLNIELSPPLILTDFEKGMINAFHTNFSESRQTGCFFHLSQNVWKRVQNFKLVTNFAASGGKLYGEYKKLQALAFVPPEDIPKAFQVVRKELSKELEPIVQYLEEYYVLGVKKIGKKAAKQPLFPPSLWSVHQNVMEKLPRTTNLVEAWHSRWSKIVATKHVGTYRMIEELRLEQKAAAEKAEIILAGAGPSKKLEYQLKDARLLKVVQNYSKYTIIDFIAAIALNLEQ